MNFIFRFLNKLKGTKKDPNINNNMQEMAQTKLMILSDIFPKPLELKPVSYIDAVSITRGKYEKIINDAINNFQSLAFTIKPKQTSITLKKSSFDFFHENLILEKIQNEANGNLRKLVQGLDKMNQMLLKEEFQYNIVWYAYFKQ